MSEEHDRLREKFAQLHAAYETRGRRLEELVSICDRLRVIDIRQGTPRARLKALGEYAEKKLGHSPLSAKGAEVAILEELKRLQAIVDKLPKCWRLNEEGKLVQDVPVLPNMMVWVWLDGELEQRIIENIAHGLVCLSDTDNWVQEMCPELVYSTREAAEAAKKASE